MSCIKVTAKNGKPSKLYQDLLAITDNEYHALELYLEHADKHTLKDENGESLITEVTPYLNAESRVAAGQHKFEFIANHLREKSRKLKGLIAVNSKKARNLQKSDYMAARKLWNRVHIWEKELNELETSIKAFNKTGVVSSITSAIDYAYKDMDHIKALFSSGFTPADINRALNVTEFWLEALDVNPNNTLLLESLGGNLPSTSLKDKILDAKNKMEVIQDLVRKERVKQAGDIIKESLGREGDISLSPKKDIWLTTRTNLDISKYDTDFAKAMHQIMIQTHNDIDSELVDNLAQIPQIVSEARAAANAMGLDFIDMIKEVDENNKETGKLVGPYSQKFWDKQTEAKKKGPKSFKTFLVKNALVINPDIFLNGTSKQKQDEVDRLLKHADIHSITKAIEEMEHRMERWEIRKAEKLAMDAPSSPSEQDKYDRWVALNDPQNVHDFIAGKQVTFKGARINNLIKDRAFYQVTYVPKKTDATGKDLGFYNTKYEIIQNNNELSNAYNKILTLTNTLYEYLPPHITKNDVTPNSIPFIFKNFLDEMSDKGFATAIAQNGKSTVKDSFISMLDSGDVAIRGEGLHTLMTLPFDKNAKYRRLVDRAKLEKQLEKKGALTQKEIKQIEANILDQMSKEKSWRLERVLATYATMAIGYKYKAQVEDQLNILRAVHEQVETPAVNSVGRTVMNAATGKAATFSKRYNSNRRLKYALAKFYNYKDDKGADIATMHTEKSKKELEQIEQLEQKLNDAKKMTTSLQESIDQQKEEIKSKATSRGIAESVVSWFRLKALGWNYTSNIANYGFGKINLWSEAAKNLEFGVKDLAAAEKLMWASTVKAVTGPVTKGGKGISLGQAKKIRALADFFNVLSDTTEQLFKQSKVAGVTQQSYKKDGSYFEQFKPYNLTQRTEYAIQIPLMIAVLKKRGLWDQFDSDGNYTGSDPKQLEKARFVIHELINQTQGNYRDPLEINSTIGGMLLGTFRRWMGESFRQRWGKSDYNDILERDIKGRYRSLASMYKHMDEDHKSVVKALIIGKQMAISTTKRLANMASFGLMRNQLGINTDFEQYITQADVDPANFDFDVKNNFTSVDAANMRANAQELSILLLSMTFSWLVRAMMKDLDDEERKYAYFMINTNARLYNDIMLYTNPKSMWKILREPVPASRLYDEVGDAFVAWYKFFQGEDEIETGPYSGQSRVFRKTLRLVPGASPIISMNNYMTQDFNQ